MRILITGSSSYIGAVLCPMLYVKHQVIPFDLADGYDICNERQIAHAMLDADAIIHLAAASTPAFCEANPDTAQRVNVEAVKMINKLRGDKPLFYPNTNIGLGAQIKQDVYNEKSPMHPNSVYGKTKCEGERLILDHGHAVVFRLASLFGYSPSMRWNLLLNFMVKEAVSTGKLELYEPNVRRNFLHVRDICRAFIHAIENYQTMKNEVYNVGLAEHPTKKEIADMIVGKIPELIVSEVDGNDPDKRDYIVSCEKLLATGWKPVHSINDGIDELIKVLHG